MLYFMESRGKQVIMHSFERTGLVLDHREGHNDE